MIQLRPYQTEIVDRTRALMQSNCRSVLIQSPTGSGKTLLTAHMLATAASKGVRSWFIVHRRELIKQSMLEFDKVGIKHGVVSAGFTSNLRAPVQIASVQTLSRRYENLKPPQLCVWDECHHVAARGWAKIHSYLTSAYHIGLTATPERLDGTGLGDWFSQMVNGPSVAELIEQGWLAPYRLYAPPGVQTEGLHTHMGDFARGELAEAADKPSITGDAIKHYLRHANGRRAVVFCVSIQHSKHVASQFAAAGVRSEHVDGETETTLRDDAVNRFRQGVTKVICNVDLFGEGFDLPALEVAILLRPTQSLGLYLQQVGRTLRPSPGKTEAMILDHAGNCMRHGLPDEDRVWSLTGRDKTKASNDNGPAVRICPQCYACQFSGKPVCGFCGFVFEIQSRTVETKEGELEEVDPKMVRIQRAREQGGANGYDELVALGERRGYKNPKGWAHFVDNARKEKRLQKVS